MYLSLFFGTLYIKAVRYLVDMIPVIQQDIQVISTWNLPQYLSVSLEKLDHQLLKPRSVIIGTCLVQFSPVFPRLSVSRCSAGNIIGTYAIALFPLLPWLPVLRCGTGYVECLTATVLLFLIPATSPCTMSRRGTLDLRIGLHFLLASEQSIIVYKLFEGTSQRILLRLSLVLIVPIEYKLLGCKLVDTRRSET